MTTTPKPSDEPERSSARVALVATDVLAPEPRIHPATVVRTLAGAAIPKDVRLEMGIDPESRKPMLRAIDAGLGTDDESH